VGRVRFGTSVHGVQDRHGDVASLRVVGAACIEGCDQGSVSSAAARALQQAFARVSRYGALDYSELASCNAALRAAVHQELAHGCDVPLDAVTIEMLSVELPAEFRSRVARPGPGDAVLVGWSDGSTYEGTAIEVDDDHVLVRFSDGQERWCPRKSLCW
jgi:hypothetical protein